MTPPSEKNAPKDRQRKVKARQKPILAGVVGSPVSHSLSPLIHTIWAQREGVNAYYVPIEIPDDDDAFREAVKSLKTIGFAGVNVTIPHKERALKYAAEASDRARLAGAANMLTFGKNGPYADNSDIEGFLAPLKEQLKEHDDKSKALVLGAGGAARGVALAIKEAGYHEITVVNRTRARAEALAGSLSESITGLKVADWSKRNEAGAGANLVVNTTSLGMTGAPPLDFALEANPKAIIADIVYAPLETDLLRAAKTKGFRTIDGLSMLMHQAAPGFCAWIGAAPVVDDDLRAHLIGELKRRAAP